MKEFLPQYAAQAVVDLEWSAKRLLRRPGMEALAASFISVAALIRQAVHVVLPVNGEIYRSNYCGGEMATEDECVSLGGLPAPVTCFEYGWNHPRGGEEQNEKARKRITLAIDGKQFHGEIHGIPPTILLYSAFFSNELNLWTLSPVALNLAQPFESHPGKAKLDWTIKTTVRSLETLLDHVTTASLSKEMLNFVGEFRPDITAVIQCCHSLRAGAAFDEQKEMSASRRWKFDKNGVGGFTYHVLKLPHGSSTRTSGDAESIGTHASPRLHVRRAHIRKLSSGTLTFVRQCFVGNKGKGAVEKHYQVDNNEIC